MFSAKLASSCQVNGDKHLWQLPCFVFKEIFFFNLQSSVQQLPYHTLQYFVYIL